MDLAVSQVLLCILNRILFSVRNPTSVRYLLGFYESFHE